LNFKRKEGGKKTREVKWRRKKSGGEKLLSVKARTLRNRRTLAPDNKERQVGRGGRKIYRKGAETQREESGKTD